MAQVIDWTGGRSEVEDVVNRLVDFHVLGNIVAQEDEARIIAQVIDVAEATGYEVIDANNVVAVGQKALAQVRTHKARSAGDDRSHWLSLFGFRSQAAVMN